MGCSLLVRNTMKLYILLVLSAVALSHPLEVTDHDLDEWEMYKVEHEKQYETEMEEEKRKMIFMGHLKFVREHNKRYESGEETYAVKINALSDLTLAEAKARLNGYRRPDGFEGEGEVFDESDDLELPKNVDWRKKGAVTEVKDQGQCGSCWAFSATGSLEGQTYLKTKQLISLSEQNLVDCGNSTGNAGCNGGLMDQAFQYIKENNGIDTEESYPYVAHGQKCHYKKKDRGATCTGYVDIPTGNEKKLAQAVAKIGPISVAIDANHEGFMHYSHGIIKIPDCSSQDLDHGVLAVGYGKIKQGKYWLVKNSWGSSWGMKGYVLMAKDHRNMCGIATAASYPTV